MMNRINMNMQNMMMCSYMCGLMCGKMATTSYNECMQMLNTVNHSISPGKL